jgi:hypothetical protein
MAAYSRRFSRRAFVPALRSFAALQNDSRLPQTVGGFFAGKDSALLLEGFVSPAGAAFQMDAFRSVSKVPIKAALDTRYHFDHSTGNSFYGTNNVPLWAHAAVARRIVDTYGPMQGAEKSAVLAPLESRVNDATLCQSCWHHPRIAFKASSRFA